MRSNIDPYVEAKIIYDRTIADLDENIRQAMDNLFILGDVTLVYSKVMVILGFNTKTMQEVGLVHEMTPEGMVTRRLRDGDL